MRPPTTNLEDTHPCHCQTWHTGLHQVHSEGPWGSNMPFSTDEEPFSFDNVAHCRDMALIGLWFMLRESEMASARECDLRLRRYALAYQYTRPTREDGSQKDRLHAAARPRYTACACGTAPRGTCSTLKLTIKGLHNNRCHFSLMKEAARHPRRHSSKRSVGWSHGQALHWPVWVNGQETQRFHRHVLRISGAQMLSSSGVELALIQLLGRWTSTAVLRYTQDSALVRVPSIPQQVIAGGDPQWHKVQMQVMTMESNATPSAAAPKSPARAARPKAFAAAVRSLQAELAQVKQAVQKPPQTFVFRPRAKILHKASPYEENNEPTRWRTPCGWGYGSRTFLRTTNEEDGNRRCRKCFNLSEASSSDSSEDSSGLSDIAASSASSADDWPAPSGWVHPSSEPTEEKS